MWYKHSSKEFKSFYVYIFIIQIIGISPTASHIAHTLHAWHFIEFCTHTHTHICIYIWTVCKFEYFCFISGVKPFRQYCCVPGMKSHLMAAIWRCTRTRGLISMGKPYKPQCNVIRPGHSQPPNGRTKDWICDNQPTVVILLCHVCIIMYLRI